MCSGFGGLEQPFDYPKGIEDLLGGGPIDPSISENKTMTPEEQIARYGETQYGMGGPMPKGYYSGPADGSYRYGEGPYAEQTQKYLDSVGMTVEEYAGPKPDNTLPFLSPFGELEQPLATAPSPVVPAPVTPQIPMQEPEVIKPITPDTTISDGDGEGSRPTIGGGITGQPTVIDMDVSSSPVYPVGGIANPFSPFGDRGGMGRQGVRPYLQSIIAMARNKEVNEIDKKAGPYYEEVQQITDRTFPDLFSGSGMGNLGGLFGGGINQFVDFPAQIGGGFGPKVDQISQPTQSNPYQMNTK